MKNYRRLGAYALMLLSAFSMIIQYGLQGVFASGHPTADLPQWFWQVDWALWALRALIEAVVILYLFETNAEHKRDRHILYAFEIALIMLITATIAPAIRAQGLHQTMPESVNAHVYTLWCVGLAAYTPLMMGGLATALRVQPGVEETVNAQVHVSTQDALAKAKKELAVLRKSAGEKDDKLSRLSQANQEHERVFAILRSEETTKNASSLARALNLHVWPNGDKPPVGVRAQLLSVSEGLIRKVDAEASNE